MTFILGTETVANPISHEPLNHRRPPDVSFTNNAANHEHSIVGERFQDASLPPEAQSCIEEAPVSVCDSIDASLKQSLVEQLYFTKIDERLTSLTAAQGKTCR